MIIKSFANIKDAWEGIYFGMLRDEPGYIDYYQRNIIHSHQNHIIAKSAVFDFDLGDIGLTKTKWTKFTGQYVDVESLHAWVNNAMNVKTYDALWSFKLVPPNFTGQKAVHQWGNCLLGLSFRRNPRPATLTLYTRAQSVGFSGVADYALLDFVARRISERIGIPQDQIRVQIYCPNFMIKMVEVVATLHRRGMLDEFKNADTRIGEAIRYYIDYMNRPDEEIRWRAARRWRKKFENSQGGLHASLPVESLTIVGWHARQTMNRQLTSREASKLILTGEGKQEVAYIPDVP